MAGHPPRHREILQQNSCLARVDFVLNGIFNFLEKTMKWFESLILKLKIGSWFNNWTFSSTKSGNISVKANNSTVHLHPDHQTRSEDFRRQDNAVNETAKFYEEHQLVNHRGYFERKDTRDIVCPRCYLNGKIIYMKFNFDKCNCLACGCEIPY